MLVGAVIRLGQALFEFSQPGRVGEIPGGKQVNALDLRNSGNIRQGQIRAAGIGIARMYVKISDEFRPEIHYRSLAYQSPTVGSPKSGIGSTHDLRRAMLPDPLGRGLP